MADPPAPGNLPSIAALPPSTTRRLSSSNALLDPSSVVKELLDNALDARANAVFVEVCANTLDSIQVKDTGHGIPAEDRPLVCRRYCTSKIRDFSDVRSVGGRWLGFRGEALASVAEVSGKVEVVTRLEGEDVAVRLCYGRDGELVSTGHASAPVGTTVKVTNFFDALPVRKEVSLKDASKNQAKIRRLMQAYAFARPTVRFSLRVLKAKSKKGDFIYAPKNDANVEDAVLKIIGKDCALECDWTVIESNSFEIRAFVPRADAVGSKIANQGCFLSVDGRPISNNHGTPKKIVAIFKDHIRKANSSFAAVREPFLCMNIVCPTGSYDPNIEPAKDDVLFEDAETLVAAVTKLFSAHYSQRDNAEISELQSEEAHFLPSKQPSNIETHIPVDRYETPISVLEEPPPSITNKATHDAQDPPRWRSSMYGIDEEDMGFIDSENQPPIIEEEEEEEDRHAADVSNPWTIARMTASLKSKQCKGDGQLISPVKSHADMLMSSSSPVRMDGTSQRLPLEPLTPQTPRMNAMPSPQCDTLVRETQQDRRINALDNQVPNQESAYSGWNPINRRNEQDEPLQPIVSSYSAPCRNMRAHQAECNEERFADEGRPSQNDWFGQPMPGSIPKPTRPRKSKISRAPDVSMFDDYDVGNQRSVRKITKNVDAVQLYSKNNSDIRSILGRRNNQSANNALHEPVDRPSSSATGSRSFEEYHSSDRPLSMQADFPDFSTQRSRSGLNICATPKPQDIFETSDFMDQLRAYAEREDNSQPRKSIENNSTRTSGHPNQPNPLPSSRKRTTDQDIAATFAAHSVAPSVSTRGQAKPPKPRPSRRRTTDGNAKRRKSSRASLTSSSQIQNVTLRLSITPRDISKTMETLAMSDNVAKWGLTLHDHASIHAYLLDPDVEDARLKLWLSRITISLAALSSQEQQLDVSALETCVKNALCERGGDTLVTPSIRFADDDPDRIAHANAAPLSDEQDDAHSVLPSVEMFDVPTASLRELMRSGFEAGRFGGTGEPDAKKEDEFSDKSDFDFEAASKFS